MKRNIKKTIKKAVVAVAAASMLTVLTAPLAVMPVSAATVTRGSYDFSNMVVRRVWFNTDDPVFLIDDFNNAVERATSLSNEFHKDFNGNPY